jgi:glycerophosphoryl diester phosphodiesterase
MSNHKSILATNTVSNAEMSNFLQGQGDQGIARRRTSGTPHKQFRRLTQRFRKRAISGWKLTPWLEKQLLEVVDFFYANLPQPIPDRQLLKQCKIVSHRGEHDNKTIFENTIAAFERVREAGVWGIEFDVRWTKDLQPVVFHDRTLQRVFKSDVELNKVTLAELKEQYRLIPSLSEVIQKYGKTLHLMVEIKEEEYPDPVYQNNVLKDLFDPLTPQIDFHFISLRPEMFILINFAPSSTFLPSARLNVKRLSHQALLKNYRGITGHYFLIIDTILKNHHKQNQRVGTGFIGSKNCLFRELNRGVNWIFSNNAVDLQTICNSLLEPETV